MSGLKQKSILAFWTAHTSPAANVARLNGNKLVEGTAKGTGAKHFYVFFPLNYTLADTVYLQVVWEVSEY